MNRRPAQPPRLREMLDPRSRLGRGLQQAAGRVPSAEQVRALDQRLFGAAGVVGLAALGAASAATRLATSASATASTATASSALAGAVPAASLKVGLAVVVALSGAVGGTLAWRTPRSSPPAPVVARRQSSPVTPGPALPHAPASPIAAARRPVPAAPTPPRLPVEYARPPSTPVAKSQGVTGVLPRLGPPARDAISRPRPQADFVTAEIALIDAARATPDPARALQLCRDHQRRFADGFLREEREVIAIAALVTLARLEDARERGARFLRSYPTSAYAAGVRDRLRNIDTRLTNQSGNAH